MRLERVAHLIEEEGLDAFLFSSASNVFYLSGFRSTHAYVILARGERHLLTDGRYYDKAKAQLSGWQVHLIDRKANDYIRKFLRERELVNVGYESDRVSCHFRTLLRSRKIKWIPYVNFLGRLRMIKSKEEVNLMREGVRLSDRIFRELLEFIEPGMTELQLRGKIVELIFKYGASGESFPAIVAGGEHSAIPHWESSEAELKNNSPLLIDMGLVWKGYCTDFTRTLHLGRASEEFRRVYSVVRDAHLFALERVREGTPLGELDRVARAYIGEKGYGKFFNHSLGHGVGIDIHESPRVYHKGEDANLRIEEGMVFTIEPGIYLPNAFGVRLENIVVVENGVGVPMSEVDLGLRIL
jgi:Xaa-Pro aminopeptidase/Xaa-Pro dipeptidase